MKIQTLFSIAALFFFLTSCKEKSDVDYSKKSEQVTDMTKPIGRKLIQKHCYLCHNPEAGQKNMIAPAMVSVKSHYLEGNPSREKFIENILNFVERPTPDKVIMKGAYRRFGLMPYQQFDKEEIRQIAEYMYDYQIEEPIWYKDHVKNAGKMKVKYNNRGKALSVKSDSDRSHAEIGMEYALNTKKQLGKNLMGQIQKNGTAAAVEFCNIRAYQITDSMATVQGTLIKRATDKPRNPRNLANGVEMEMINTFSRLISESQAIKPISKISDDRVHVYYPITTNNMCLQCHGDPGEDIAPQVYEKLKRQYPEDQATGYDVNQLRGVWHVSYDL